MPTRHHDHDGREQLSELNYLVADFVTSKKRTFSGNAQEFPCRIMPRASPWRDCKVCSFITQQRQSAPLTPTGEARTETVLIRVVETFLILKRIDCVIVKAFDRAIGYISEPGTLRNFSTNVNLSALLVILVISKQLFSYAGICFVRSGGSIHSPYAGRAKFSTECNMTSCPYVHCKPQHCTACSGYC